MTITIYHASDKIWREGDIVFKVGEFEFGRTIIRVAQVLSRSEGTPNTTTVVECAVYTHWEHPKVEGE